MMPRVMSILLVCGLSCAGFAETGKASWYGREACRYNPDITCPTASGISLYWLEDHDALFCASNAYKLGTRLKVTNLANDKSVIVTVRDRGGFGKYDRILDLGKLAFSKIADLKTGVINVRIERADRH